jgi:integrase
VKLTDVLVRSLAPRKARYDIREGAGLLVRVFPSGERSFQVVYDFAGRRRRLTLGAYDRRSYSLAQARKDHKAAMALLARGIDPGAEKARAKAQAKEEAANTVAAAVATYLAQHVERKLRPGTIAHYRHVLATLVARHGGKPLTTLARGHMLELTEGLVAEDKPGAAVLAHRILVGFCHWCVARAYLAASPMAGLKSPARVASRDRVLTDAELRTVWTAAGRLEYPWRQLVWLLVLTGQRRSEVAAMRWEDLDGALWHIPDTKRGTPHALILPPLALAVLDTVPRYGAFVLSCSAGERPATVGSKLKAEPDPRRVRTKGNRKPRGHRPGLLDVELAKLAAEDPERYPLPAPWRLQDLRRTAASGMARLGVAPHVIEAVLNHRSGRVSGIARVYNRFSYAEESAHALAVWADHVERLAGGSPGENVVRLRRAETA